MEAVIQSVDIEEVEVGKLLPYPKNVNKHPKEQIERLAELIKYQGFRVPLIVERETMQVVAGHGRLEAAKLVGMTHVPVTFQDFESEDQKYAFMVSDNSIAEQAELDMSAIHRDIPELELPSIEMLGFKNFRFEPDINLINRGDENSEWAQGMPDFEKGDDYIKLSYIFGSEEEREKFVIQNKIEVKTKRSKHSWLVYP